MYSKLSTPFTELVSLEIDFIKACAETIKTLDSASEKNEELRNDLVKIAQTTLWDESTYIPVKNGQTAFFDNHIETALGSFNQNALGELIVVCCALAKKQEVLEKYQSLTPSPILFLSQWILLLKTLREEACSPILDKATAILNYVITSLSDLAYRELKETTKPSLSPKKGLFIKFLEVFSIKSDENALWMRITSFIEEVQFKPTISTTPVKTPSTSMENVSSLWIIGISALLDQKNGYNSYLIDFLKAHKVTIILITNQTSPLLTLEVLNYLIEQKIDVDRIITPEEFTQNKYELGNYYWKKVYPSEYGMLESKKNGNFEFSKLPDTNTCDLNAIHNALMQKYKTKHVVIIDKDSSTSIKPPTDYYSTQKFEQCIAYIFEFTLDYSYINKRLLEALEKNCFNGVKQALILGANSNAVHPKYPSLLHLAYYEKKDRRIVMELLYWGANTEIKENTWFAKAAKDLFPKQIKQKQAVISLFSNNTNLKNYDELIKEALTLYSKSYAKQEKCEENCENMLDQTSKTVFKKTNPLKKYKYEIKLQIQAGTIKLDSIYSALIHFLEDETKIQAVFTGTDSSLNPFKIQWSNDGFYKLPKYSELNVNDFEIIDTPPNFQNGS